MVDDHLSRVFAALADPTRRDMVARLAVGDATVGELADPYDVSVQAVSKHIKVLTDAGLVTQSKDAQRRPCHLEAEVFDLMTKWIERYRQRPPVVASQSRISVSIRFGPTQRANSSGSVCARISSSGVASKSRVMRMIGRAGSASIDTW